MEGLHHRKKKEEERVDYLDEQEQSELIEELKRQNDKANVNIKRVLVIMGVITSVLYISLLMDTDTHPVIPISQISSHLTPTVLPHPKLSATLNMFAMAMSIFTLLFGLTDAPIYQLMIALITSLVVPIQCIYFHSSTIELVYWMIPLLQLLMYYSAYRMMKQVQDHLDELEKSKYNFKGA
ncbi:hypothetical protein BDB01DRAFT_159651 [Pilobolus umbonatus]|nr:hypothetical protein BDB01DRAFT_159651 [Pilobolus umbonatus]